MKMMNNNKMMMMKIMNRQDRINKNRYKNKLMINN